MFIWVKKKVYKKYKKNTENHTNNQYVFIDVK